MAPAAGDTDGLTTVLVVEDHADSRDALCALLEAFGFRVLAAVDGLDALRIVREEPPDLILMDLMMPEMDGFQATRALREDPDTAHIPIITLTALDGARRLAKKAGADDFLVKPIDSTRLMATLRAHLEDG